MPDMPARGAAGPLLRAVGVEKRFGGVRAVRGVDWMIDEGEICGIVGPNGSGKTTFFNCLSGFHRLSGGCVEWQGDDVSRLPMRTRARRGLVRTFQHAQVFTTLGVAENVSVALRHARTDTLLPRRLPDLLGLVGLGDVAEVPAGSLSFGKRRLLGIAMAVALGPALLLLDEPTSGLSDDESSEVQARLSNLRDLGLAIAIIDHHMEFLLPLCDRIALLRSGELLWQGPPSEFVHDETVLQVYLGSRAAIP